MVSVIVPVYNVERYLRKCIESILNQTYQDLEVILVDDGSKDCSGNICDEYAAKDARIRVIHKENGGLSDARNCGIDVAKGEYLLFVDSDDFIHSQMLEVLYDAMQDIGADISVCNFLNVPEGQDLQQETITDPSRHIYREQEKLAQLYVNNLVTVVAWNKLYSRRLFQTLRYPKGRLHEDEFVIHRLLFEARSVVYVDVVLYYYVQRQNSIMGKYSIKNIRDGYDALVEREVFWLEKKEQEAYAQTLVHRLYHAEKQYFYAKEKLKDCQLLKILQKNIGAKIHLDAVKQLLGKETYICFRVFQISPTFYKWYAKQRKQNGILYKCFRRIFWVIIKF